MPRRPLIAIAAPWLATAMFAAFLFSHDPISQTYVRLTAPFRHADVETVLNLGFIALGLLLVLLVVLRSRGRLRAVLAETAFVGLLLAGLDHWLIFTYLERVHFAQYALLGLLLRLMTTRDFPALLLLHAAGMADEFVQYAWNPQYTKYLDFNDMLLNLGGGMLGLLLFHALRPRSAATPSRERGMLLLGASGHLLPALFLGGGMLLGRVALHAEGLETDSVWRMIDGAQRFVVAFVPQGGTEFSAATQKYCRVLSISQWIVVTLLVWSAYALLLRLLRPHGRDDAERDRKRRTAETTAPLPGTPKENRARRGGGRS